jgi:hypothetical protein
MDVQTDVSVAATFETPGSSVEQHFTPKGTGEKLSLSIPAVRALERRGELRGVRIAGRLRFSASAINEYLARCANAPRRIPPPELLANAGRRSKRRR